MSSRSARLGWTAASAALLLCAPSALRGQDRSGETNPLVLFSVVSAADGRPVAGAVVELMPLGRSTITDSLGRATLRAVPAGEYTLSVRHFAFHDGTETVSVAADEAVEYRISVAPRAIAVEPLTVQVTGRDPYLVNRGFYRRQGMVKSGYFATIEEIQSYTMFNTLFDFQRDLSVRLSEHVVLFLNGLPAKRFGYRSLRELNDIPFKNVRGIEAYPCNEAPDEMMIHIPVDLHNPLTKCNLIVVWTR